MPSFILTLKLDAVSFERLQAWRTRYFPAALNQIPAHLTLLHTVSPQQVNRLRERWPSFESSMALPLNYVAPRFLGRGVAIGIESPSLDAMRARIVEAMDGELTRQDQQRFSAHVTIQNKVEASVAKALFESLRLSFEPWTGSGEAVLIWRYLGGPWSLESEHLIGKR